MGYTLKKVNGPLLSLLNDRFIQKNGLFYKMLLLSLLWHFKVVGVS